MAERVRRLRMVSQAISGSLGVAARPYYEGSPWLVDCPRTNAGGSPRDQEAERSVRVVNGAVPTAKIAAVERREASVSIARRAPRLASVELLMRLSALRSLGHFSGDDSPWAHFSGDDSPGPPGDTKTGGPVA